MTVIAATALIADDEPLLREALAVQLARVWPELRVVAQARNGREAVELFEQHQPQVCFLDVHMPGLSGIEAARQIGRRSQLVFVTAYDRYAVQAFEQGVLDYLVKPVEAVRLAETATRLRERLAAAVTPPNLEALLHQLTAQIQGATKPAPLRWIRAQVGATLRLIAADEIDYLRADSKYTAIIWRGDGGAPAEALVRTPLKQLVAQLDPEQFVQVHRSAVVNLRAVSHVSRGDNETATVHLKGGRGLLPVSRSYLHHFRQM